MRSSDTEVERANTSRYTFDGDAAVEGVIDRHQQLIGNAVIELLGTSDFCALILIGGYGRAEGGFCYIDGEPAPYNDYDYFVVINDMPKQKLQELTKRLSILAKELEEKVGIEVDFWPMQQGEIARLEFSLMFSEMQWGSRIVAGDKTILDSMPSMPFGKLPLSEFTRLMLNRGALLLLNRIEMAKGEISDPVQREIFIKYLFKAILACGDASLAARGVYHPSYPVKLERLKEMTGDAGIPQLLAQFEMALDARFHPDYSKYLERDILAWQQQVTDIWLHTMRTLEEARLAKPIKSWQTYAKPSVDKGQSATGPKAVMRNVAINVRDFGPGVLLSVSGWKWRYPRERLISVLPMLLEKESDDIDEVTASGLGMSSYDWSVAADRFINLWHKYA